MSLTLQEIYDTTHKKHKLTLLAGEKGLYRCMSWVYVTEDLNTVDFLQGGELIITTGLSCSSRAHWLFDFIKNMVHQNTCGIIVNTGKYILPEDISQEILDYCDQNQYPLFIMPWEIHIYDISKDYYNRIFLETESYNRITSSLVRILHHDPHPEESLAILADEGFLMDGSYCICALKTYDELSNFSSVTRLRDRLYTLLTSTIPDNPITVHLMLHRNFLLAIFYNVENKYIETCTRALLTLLPKSSEMPPKLAGISENKQGLLLLPNRFKQAISTLMLCSQKNQTGIMFFKDMGFFRLLFDMENKEALTSYMEEFLSPLFQHDKLHDTEYLETLRYYLLCHGSVQDMANALYCHRNTINYRIRILKEQFHYQLNDPIACHEYLTAFYIADYLQMII